MTGFSFQGLDEYDFMKPQAQGQATNLPASAIPGIELEDLEILRQKKKKREEEGMYAADGFDPSMVQDAGEVPSWQKDLDRDIGLSGGRTLSKRKSGEFNEGPLKGKTKGQAYEEYKARGEARAQQPSRVVQSGSGEILSTGTQNPRPIESGLLDRGSPAERRARMDQEAAKRVAAGRAAVQAKKFEQYERREKENMDIGKYGRATKDGVTRFYSDEDRNAAIRSAADSMEARRIARSGGDMDAARELAKSSMESDRSNARSSKGRGTFVQTDPKYTPFGSPGYGVGGVALTNDPSSDDKTRWGDSMSLDTAKETLAGGGKSIPGIDAGLMQAVNDMDRKTAGDRVGSAIRDTFMSEMNRSGGAPGYSSPEAMASKPPAPTPSAPKPDQKKKRPQSYLS